MNCKFLQISKFFVRRATLRRGQENFMDLIKTAKGSKIPITNIEKQKINNDIDAKMQELEDTGLSKQQILLSKSRKGLPLKIDPFFQYLKHNRLAREVYLKPEERFTIEKVIDIALRQDIGPDSSYSTIRLPQFNQTKMRAQHLDNLVERDEKAFDPQNYYGNQSFSVGKAYDELKPNQDIQHIYRPIDKYERVKKNARKLKKYDVHWRNIELIRQFVTRYGNIKSHLINALTRSDQNKVTKAIKTARHMHAMPHYGQTPAPLKKSITCIQDEVQEIGQQHVNLQTGHLYFSRTRSMDSLEVEMDKKGDIDTNYRKMQERGSSYKIWFDNIDPLSKEPDIEIVESNKFARSMKEKEIDSNVSKTTKEKQAERLARSAFRDMTGLTDEQEYTQFQFKFQKSEEKECQDAFFERAERLRKEFDQNPYSFSEILMKEKTQI